MQNIDLLNIIKSNIMYIFLAMFKNIVYLKGHCCLDELVVKPSVTMLLKNTPRYI